MDEKANFPVWFFVKVDALGLFLHNPPLS